MPKGIKKLNNEWRRNLSLAKKGKTYEQIYGIEKAKTMKKQRSKSSKGRKVTINTREKISNALKGRKLNKEWINKIVQTRRRNNSYIISPKNLKKLIEFNKGKKMSEETKLKIGMSNSIALKGKKQPKELIEKRRKAMIKMWSTLKNTSRHDEIKKKISKSNKGKLKSSGSFTKESRSLIVIPKQDTKIELKIQSLLENLGIEYIKHWYVSDIKNRYRCDIFIPSKKLIIECDGDYWHGNPKIYRKEELNEKQLEQRERDEIRTKQMLLNGYKILRLWESEIKNITEVELFNKMEVLS